MLRSAFLLTLLPALAWGRIGETRAQMEARYGPGKDIGDQTLYTTDQTSVTVFYAITGGPQDRVTMEIMGNRSTADGGRVAFTPDEVDALLKDEGAGLAWLRVSNDKTGAWAWCRADGKVFARQEQDTVVFRGKESAGLAPPAAPGVVLHDGKK